MAHLNVEHTSIIQKDLDNVTNVLVDLFNISPNVEPKHIKNQHFALENYEHFLIKLMTYDVLKTREERLAVANLLHKIQSRREEIALITGELTIEDIEDTSGNLGKRMAIPDNEPYGFSFSSR